MNNILLRFQDLQQDFVGISLNAFGVFEFFKDLTISIFIILILYLLGNKTYVYFFKPESGDTESSLASIAIGYVIFGTGIAILGLFSLLSPLILSGYLGVVLFVSIFPIKNCISIMGKLKSLMKIYRHGFSKHIWLFIGVLLFVIIAFLRLIPPDTGVDGIGYHADYPKLYLEKQSLMIKPQGTEYAITVPQLGEMLYVAMYFLGVENGPRILHFIFYFLAILLITYISLIRKISLFTVILFVTTPVIIRITSTANTDFQWIYCWILLFFILTKKETKTGSIFLPAILFGAVLATKIQGLIFFPFFTAYIFIANYKISLKTLLNQIFFFTLIALSIPLIWYLRAYLLTGNPFYPNFAKDTGYILVAGIPSFEESYTFDAVKFKVTNILSNLSPIMFIGLLFFILKPSRILQDIGKGMSIFIALLMAIYMLLPTFYFSGRYLLFGYLILIFILAQALSSQSHAKCFKIFLSFFFLIMFTYYSLTTIAVIPYGFGWADKNVYLGRILSQDNSSYFDYGNLFSKKVLPNETVATFGLWGFYYADFSHKEISYFLKNKKSLKQLSQAGIRKVIVKGGDMKWLCKKINISDCDSDSYGTIAYYKPAMQYMYVVK